MRVLLVSPLCSRSVYRSSVPEALRTGQAMQKFHRLLASGLGENGAQVHVLSAPPVEQLVGRWSYHPPADEEEGIAFTYTRTLRPRALGRVARFCETVWRVWRGARAGADVVLADPMNVLPFIAAWVGTRLARTPLVGVVADVPTSYAGDVGSERISVARRVSGHMMTRADAYVLLTAQMDALVNPHARPSVVVEGIAQTTGRTGHRPAAEGAGPRVMLYAGGIRKAYGLDRLLEAFALVGDPDWEFHIYGGGSFASEFAALAAEVAGARYLGVKDNDVVVEEQERAALLVNPRLSGHEYTRYSFPSKIIEYMGSGVPTLTTRLPGIPDAYAPYLLFFEDESLEGMRRTLEQVFGMAEDERRAVGHRAQHWIATTKSARAQAGVVLDLLTSVTRTPAATGRR